MGKFDLDDLLEDLGRPHPGAPRENPNVGADAEDASVSSRPAIPGLRAVAGTQGFVPRESPSLVATLVDRAVINSELALSTDRLQKQTPGRPIAHLLVDAGIDEAAVQEVTAELESMPFERIDAQSDAPCDLKYVKRLSSEWCERNLALPLRREGHRLVVGTADPADVFLLDEIRRRTGASFIRHVLVTGYDIRGVLELQKSPAEAEGDQAYAVEDMLSEVEEDDVEVLREKSVDEGVDEADSSPVVRYVNHIIQSAIKEGASDIHIEPEERFTRVRFRIDGILFEMMTPPRKMHAAITSRLKIMANLDIAEKRLPQDGRIRATVNNRKLDLRVSTVPTPKGEKTVMRILNEKAISVSLDDLGFSEDTLTIWRGQVNQPHGIILVTGPTGSGKTTTLYASLQTLDLRKMNVSTVEDPVEYNLAGITQIQTHDRIGMTFAKALKALLRQDPDVVMLGEIRDLETATTAIQAAMTGHLVLSTLHTNDAPSSVTRLINIGIEPFLVAAACNAVLAQRLVRRICTNCKTESPIDPELADYLVMHGVSRQTLATGKGCGRCRETGYSGRQGLYELLVLDDHIRDAIARNPNVTEFRRQCAERGMVSLREDGFRKVELGTTTVEEILRVTEATI